MSTDGAYARAAGKGRRPSTWYVDECLPWRPWAVRRKKRGRRVMRRPLADWFRTAQTVWLISPSSSDPKRFLLSYQ